MKLLKTLWSLLFRLFPCPTQVGLRRVGNPARSSPVLVTCNFYLTVERLTWTLRRAGVDAWLLVADSKGVNVWCAAGGDGFNTQSVVSAVKTSGIADLVSHRTLILPPLAAPSVRAVDVEKQTGWKARWGPVRASDVPRYFADRGRREEGMKRVTYDWNERLDTGLGSLFPIYFSGAAGFALFGRGLLVEYLLVGAVAFLFFVLLCPWIPGQRGLTKAVSINILLAGVLVVTEFLFTPGDSPIRKHLIIAMVAMPIYGGELGGMASTLRSDLDPFLARLGIGTVGKLSFAGALRTELLNGYRELSCDRALCIGCRACVEICPQGVWDMDEHNRAVLARKTDCTACRACITQCSSGAIQALGPDEIRDRDSERSTQPTGWRSLKVNLKRNQERRIP